MVRVHYFLFFIFALVATLCVRRQTELDQLRLVFISLISNQSDMDTFKVDKLSKYIGLLILPAVSMSFHIVLSGILGTLNVLMG